MGKLTQHFQLSEFTRSQVAARKGIDNTPGIVEQRNLLHLARNLENVRNRLDGSPIRISSGYRCPELNEAIGGSKTSAHRRGLAADFECPGIPNIEIFQRLFRKATYDQLIGEYLSADDDAAGWIHIGLAPEGAKLRDEAWVITADKRRLYSMEAIKREFPS